MKNLQNLNLTELKTINGGELPGTYGAVRPGNWKGLAHAIGDFIDGFMDGL
jgi:hypothetical protein